MEIKSHIENIGSSNSGPNLLEAMVYLVVGLGWLGKLPTSLVVVSLLVIVVIHLILLIVLHIISLLIAHVVWVIIIIVVMHWLWHWLSWCLVAAEVLRVWSIHGVAGADWVGSFQEILIVSFGVEVISVVDLLKDWESWHLWGTASIWGLEVGPKAVSSTKAVTINLLISQMCESRSLFQSLFVSKLSFEIVDWVEILASFSVSTSSLLMELHA